MRRSSYAQVTAPSPKVPIPCITGLCMHGRASLDKWAVRGFYCSADAIDFKRADRGGESVQYEATSRRRLLGGSVMASLGAAFSASPLPALATKMVSGIDICSESRNHPEPDDRCASGAFDGLHFQNPTTDHPQGWISG
jgi:hypothetical protein